MSPRYLVSTGRVLLSVIFLLSGLSKIIEWIPTQQYMAAKGIPFVLAFLLCAIAIELTGGLSVLLGWKARWGALLLFFYLIPTTLFFHNFWSLGGIERQTEMVNLLKNLSIMGGLLLVVACDAMALAQSVSDDFLAGDTGPRFRRAG